MAKRFSMGSSKCCEYFSFALLTGMYLARWFHCIVISVRKIIPRLHSTKRQWRILQKVVHTYIIFVAIAVLLQLFVIFVEINSRRNWKVKLETRKAVHRDYEHEMSSDQKKFFITIDSVERTV